MSDEKTVPTGEWLAFKVQQAISRIPEGSNTLPELPNGLRVHYATITPDGKFASEVNVDIKPRGPDDVLAISGPGFCILAFEEGCVQVLSPQSIRIVKDMGLDKDRLIGPYPAVGLQTQATYDLLKSKSLAIIAKPEAADAP